MQNISAANISKILENISKLPQKSRKIFPNYCKTIWCFPPRGRQREGGHMRLVRNFSTGTRTLSYQRSFELFLGEAADSFLWDVSKSFLRILGPFFSEASSQVIFLSKNIFAQQPAAACCNLQKVLNRYKVLTLSWGDTSPIWRSAAIRFYKLRTSHRSQDPSH